MLSATEQIVLRRLAVFAGSFTLQAAKTVASDEEVAPGLIFEHVGSMIRKSMVAVVPGIKRFRLLQTTRAFMLEKLGISEEARAVRKRHAHFLLQLLERAIEEWEITSDAVWLARYGMLLDDVRDALDWATEEEPSTAIALAGTSWPLWRELSLRTEGQKRLSSAVALLHPDTPAELEARLRHGLGDMLANTTATKASHAEFTRAVELYRSLRDPRCLGRALAGLGYTKFRLGQLAEAENAVSEALEVLQRDRWPRSLATAYSVRAPGCWRDPAGESPARVGRSGRSVASVAGRKVTTAAKRTQRLCRVSY